MRRLFDEPRYNKLLRGGIVSVAAVLWVAASTLAPAAELNPEERLSAALALGYSEGDVAGSIAHLEAAVRQAPKDAEIRAYLARAMATIGDKERAHKQADQAIHLAPDSANALFAKSQALLLSGDMDAALDLALDTISRDGVKHSAGTRGALTLSTVAMLMKSGDYLTAEQILTQQNPELVDLVDRKLPKSADEIGGSWHRIQTLATIYTSTGRVSEGQSLSLRLAPLTEDFFRTQNDGQLSGPALWNLAATGTGRIGDDEAIDHLERAIDAGFILGWRYNYAQHPTLWLLRDNPRFVALLDRLEFEMTRQQAQLDQCAGS